ncbi:unnamed protein product [Heterotrigona itama]|uniref:Uncharacterized protein n=1 Tax=Heterotrigona itama TaxID=395501 RepID=A0A6V7GXK3_9HYME|nr:unnamed protein product [Heterotrigona itama]
MRPEYACSGLQSANRETHARRYVGTSHIGHGFSRQPRVLSVSAGPEKSEETRLASAYFPPVPAVRVARTQPALLRPSTTTPSTFFTRTKTDSNIGRRTKERLL